jgi:hypothetical protein
MPQRTSKKAAPKRAVSKTDGRPVLVYFPENVVDVVDRVVVAEDTDRSKWIRQACREALQRRGVTVA